MFAKLAAVIAALGVCACTLLALRQSRLQAASELAQTQIRIGKLDEELWRLRARIASGTAPQKVEVMAGDLGPLVPMVPGATVQSQASPAPEPATKGQQKPQPKKPAAAHGGPTALARGGQ